MTTTVTVRNFTGKTISVEVNPATKVSGLKDTIAQTTLCKWAKPALTWKGHELRDHQSLSHYNVADRDVLYICERQFFGLKSRMVFDLGKWSVPPSKVPKIFLQFEKSDGSHFTLEVNSDITIAQLKRDVAVEEKIDVPKLKFVSSMEDPEDPETVFVSEPQDLPEEALISQYPLSNSTIVICGPPPPLKPPPTFNVHVILYDDARKLDVEAKLQQTLNEFREAVLLQHDVSIADDVLMLVGKEVVGDEIPIWDLGFVPDCTVHAGELAQNSTRLRTSLTSFYVL